MKNLKETEISSIIEQQQDISGVYCRVGFE